MKGDDWTAAKAEAMEAELLGQAAQFRRIAPRLTGLVGLFERAANMIQTQRLLLEQLLDSERNHVDVDRELVERRLEELRDS